MSTNPDWVERVRTLRETVDFIENQNLPSPRQTSNPNRPMVTPNPTSMAASGTSGNLSSAVRRTASMLAAASTNSNTPRRMGSSERLRAGGSGSGRKRRAEKKEEPVIKIIEFALLRGIEEEEGSTLKWDSKVCLGVMSVAETASGDDLRIKICEAVNKKYPAVGKNDFEFIKLRKKSITFPELSSGTEFNYPVSKKLAGQGTLYVMLKCHLNFLLGEDDSDDDDAPSVVPPLSPTSTTLPHTHTARSSTSTSIIHPPVSPISTSTIVIPSVLSISTGTLPSSTIPHSITLPGSSLFNDTFPPSIMIDDLPQPSLAAPSSPPPGSSTTPTLDVVVIQEIKERDIVDPVEILRFIQIRLMKGRALNLAETSETIDGDTNEIMIDRDNVVNTSFGELEFVGHFQGIVSR